MTETLKVGKVDFDVHLLYKYKIKGQVLATYHYLPFSTSNKMSPVDVGLAWGYLLNEPDFKNMKCHETGFRRLICTSPPSLDVEGLYSNNHLVASNKETKRLMKKIKKGDYIQIEGYLVNMYWGTKNSRSYWTSSTSRFDSGDGACELIYVTDIKWLKEK